MQGVSIDGQTGDITFSRDVTRVWQVVYEMKRTKSGQLVIASMRVRTVGSLPEEGLTAAVLKQIRLGPVRAYAALNSPASLKANSPPMKGKTRGRPRTLTLGFYRKVWNRHRELIETLDKNPAKTLADEYGYNRSSMRALLRRCRQMPELQNTLKGGQNATKTRKR